MKTLIICSAVLLATFSVKGQDNVTQKGVPLKLDSKKNTPEITLLDSLSKKPKIYAYQFRKKNVDNNPFVLRPYRDSLGLKAVDIPNSYNKAFDQSVAMPSSTPADRPTPHIEQLVKPRKRSGTKD